MAALWERVLVRLDDRLSLSVEQIDKALSFSPVSGSLTPPGAEAVREALAALERMGFATEGPDGWVLTPSGMGEYNRRDDAFENSGRRGDYGF